MSSARAHLRVCDAYGNRKAAVVLDQTFYELGSDQARANQPGYILLTGSGVAPRHARLIKRDDGWEVLPLTAAGAKLGRREIAKDTPETLTGGNDLWLGNNLLNLLLPNSPVTVSISNPNLADIELMMNEALLDYEDRRRDLFDGSDGQREALLSAELDRLLDIELDLAGKPDMLATVNRYCAEALRRPLISACLLAGTRGDIERGLSREQPIWAEMHDAANPWDEILRDVRPRGRIMDMRGSGQGTMTMTNLMQAQGPVNSSQTFLYPQNELFTHNDRPFQRGHDQVIWEELRIHPTYLLFPNVFPSR